MDDSSKLLLQVFKEQRILERLISDAMQLQTDIYKGALSFKDETKKTFLHQAASDTSTILNLLQEINKS